MKLAANGLDQGADHMPVVKIVDVNGDQNRECGVSVAQAAGTLHG